MEPLENPAMSGYCHSPYPCGFDHILRELEAMAGTDVNAVVETSFNSHRELLRCNGRFGLAEDVPALESSSCATPSEMATRGFDISEDDFNRGQLVPGMVWFEAKSGVVLTIERRHFPPELEGAG